MFLKKFFVGVLLVFGVITNSIAIEEPTTEEYTWLKFFQQTKISGDVSKVTSGIATFLDLTDLEVVNALLSSQKDTYIELSALYNVRLAEGKTLGLSLIKNAKDDVLNDIQIKGMTYFELSEKFSNYAGTGLDMLGMGLDAYDVGQNIGRIMEGDGNVLVNSLKLSQNAYGIITASGTLVAKLVPKGGYSFNKFC